MSKTGISDSALCECLDCNTAFCRANTKHAEGVHCRHYNNCSRETSVLYANEDSLDNPIDNTDAVHDSIDKSAVVNKTHYSKHINKSNIDDMDSLEFTYKMDYLPHTSVEIKCTEEDANTNRHDNCEDFTHDSRKQMSTTTARLSAQVMNMPYKEFKETISREQLDKYNVYDILKKLKEAYDSCTCKICECIAGRPNESQSCSCKPCDCKDCAYLRTDELLEEVKNKSCYCQPCECINCAKLHKPIPCDCKPCQCVVCKGVAVDRSKMVIVAPVGEGSQRADCLCAPCDCPRCRQRALNMSLSRVHEMSTGINRHPNCHCEVCMDDSCEPNGTETCRCQGRHGVIRKPVEKNPHDFDIRRTIVFNNPINTRPQNVRARTVSTYSAMEKNKYPSYRTKLTATQCKCSMCECIACEYKDDLSNSTTILDKSLRTLKLPSMDLKDCNCSPCECLRCISKKYEHCTETGQMKNCSCDVCDCLYCEGAAKPGNAVSSMIPVTEMSSNKLEPPLGPASDNCNDCSKPGRHSDICQCDICRCIQCTDKGNMSEEGLYPIKKGELLTASRMRTDPISELELPSQSSEYTQLKHSKGQSNVFKRESKASEKTKREFTVLHLIPRQRAKQLLQRPTTPSKSVMIGDKLDPSDNILRIELSEENTMTQFYCASTSKTLSADVILKTTNNFCSYNGSKIESNETACIYDSNGINKSYEYQNSPLSSASLSKHGLLNLPPSTSDSKNRTSQSLLLKQKVEKVSKPLEAKKEITAKEVSFVTCANGVQRKGTIHDGYDRPALLHNTFVYTAISSNKFNVEENPDILEEPPLNKDDYTLENRFYWKLEHSCSYSDDTDLKLLSNNELYKTALRTLEKSRKFSQELVNLLEQYETANLEFESISEKLKKSHNSVINDFDLCSRTCTGINSKIKSIGFIASVQNHKKKIPNIFDNTIAGLKDRDINLSFIREHSDTFPEKNPTKFNNPADLLQFEHISQGAKVSGEKCEGYQQIELGIRPMTENYKSSTTGLIRLVNEEVIIDKHSMVPKNRMDIYKKFKDFSAFINDTAKQINALLPNKKSEELSRAQTDSRKPIEIEDVKALIHQEILKTWKEYSIDGHKKTKNCLGKTASPIYLRRKRYLKKRKEELRIKVYSPNDEEKCQSVQSLSEGGRSSCCYKSQELALNLKNEWSFANPLLVAPVEFEKECNPKVMVKETCSANCEKKAQFSSLRRVSDHSVLIKWETPSCVKDVKGYEILVDGRSAQKIFSPARCIAVVTCLPRAEQVLLTIRTLIGDRRGGHPSSTITYRPRAKYTRY